MAFVAVEGADGTGKSTLTRELAALLSAIPFSTPPRKYLNFRERVDKDASAEEHYAFYRDGIYDAQPELGEMLKRGTVVTDRYWLSTYTYHRAMDVEVPLSDFTRIILPDLTVILTLGDDVQIGRMLARGLSAGDRRMLDRQSELKLAFFQDALALGIPFISLDTGVFSPQACAEIVRTAILSLK